MLVDIFGLFLARRTTNQFFEGMTQKSNWSSLGCVMIEEDHISLACVIEIFLVLTQAILCGLTCSLPVFVSCSSLVREKTSESEREAERRMFSDKRSDRSVAARVI